MLEGKNIARIRGRQRLVKVLVELGSGEKEQWYELGHFYQGAERSFTWIKETTGEKTERSANRGILDFTGELAQNTIDDYDLYYRAIGTKRGVAFVTGNMLRIFRKTKEQDNRVSIAIDDKYARKDLAPIRITGFVDGFEETYVETVSIGKSREIVFSPKNKIKRRGTWPPAKSILKTDTTKD